MVNRQIGLEKLSYNTNSLSIWGEYFGNMITIPIRSLILIWLLCAAGIAFAQSDTIQSGDSIDGHLTDDNLAVSYTFSAEQGDKIAATLSSRQFDALLHIIDADDDTLISNDDSEGSLNSVIEDYEIPADGEYSIVVTSSDGKGVGGYTVSFKQIDSTEMTYGDSIQANFTDSQQDFYQFEGEGGDVISIRMTSNHIDSFIRLSDENFEIMADDNGGGGWNAMITAFTLPQTGTYEIAAMPSYDNGIDGDYMLYLDLVEATPIPVNETITGTINGQPLYYMIETQMGDTLSVYVKSDDGLLDTLLNVKSDYTWYGLDDDSGYHYDPEIINIVISNPAPLTVIVIPSSEDTQGEFELTVSVTPATELTCDAQSTLLFSNKVTQIPFWINVAIGQAIELTYTNTTNNTTDLLTYFVMNDSYLGEEYNIYDDRQWQTAVEATESGQLYIMASDYSQRGTAYELQVSCSE